MEVGQQRKSIATIQFHEMCFYYTVVEPLYWIILIGEPWYMKA